MKTHTTTADFQAFKAECQKWIERFGLSEWKVEYHHHDFGDDNRKQAQCCYSVDSKAAALRLAKRVLPDAFGYIPLREAARHEVLHLLLAEYCDVCVASEANSDVALVAAEHSVINRLLRVLR